MYESSVWGFRKLDHEVITANIRIYIDCIFSIIILCSVAPYLSYMLKLSVMFFIKQLDHIRFISWPVTSQVSHTVATKRAEINKIQIFHGSVVTNNLSASFD